ncbi:protein-L-isoaspartate(D-aspartate) O-methyltransferase [Geosmithia morbida]|uniref:protein-L-isoaspartate(D-aspartate) O-methyltransferase n=1 Tax=Geosmithia morbida TaxID=1094350 RepID=A0A9P4YRS9_9HYPO|nr:protein-L-isoaspartate(D-aspartate) O-methyltransferase [Geosmithia morbida]KAF4120895.1 protein-L-isoaspartate(D-aspartate) O-methyltransferase [Geosmithia morbida]
MAWRCSGATNAELVENMFRKGLITDATVKQAFLGVDRAHYAPSRPYNDSPQSIGHAATISAPHMHASAVENVLSYLVPRDDGQSRRVLDIGSGSGYLTHILAELAGPTGLVVGLEHIPELRDLGRSNMAKSAEGRSLLDSGRVKFRLGDGRKGWVEGGTADWDVIHVGAAAKELHAPLLEQLKAPGCMFIPINDDESGVDKSAWRISKNKYGQVTKKKLYGVRYVPLTDAPSR